jgi:hypothetical protein
VEGCRLRFPVLDEAVYFLVHDPRVALQHFADVGTIAGVWECETKDIATLQAVYVLHELSALECSHVLSRKCEPFAALFVDSIKAPKAMKNEGRLHFGEGQTCLADTHTLDAEQQGKLGELDGFSSQADGAVVRCALLVPILHKAACANGETITAIRVANLEDGAWHGLALRKYKL